MNISHPSCNKILRNFIGMVFIVLLASACQGAATGTETPTAVPSATLEPTSQPTATLTLMEQNPAEWVAWKGGPHAAGYDPSKGPNTYCARCHSPANWDPQAVINDPPNCVSCKFQNETEMRIAVGNPPVPEAEWKGLECGTCHKVQEGRLAAEPTWYDKQTGYYESVGTTTKLCEKCHLDNETLRHKRELGEETHIGFTCTNCHDPHSMQASCTQSGCHDNWGSTTTAGTIPHPSMGMGTSVSCSEAGCHSGTNFSDKPTPSAITGFTWNHQDGLHTAVTCVACHDASGLPAKYLEDQKIWVVFRVTELLGRYNEKVYQSHALTRSVNCSRCHYIDNPWGLVESVGWTTEE